MKRLLVCLFLLAPLSSQALFEIRAGVGTTQMDEDTYGGFAVDDMKGYNLDVIFEPPLLTDMGFGLRYEKMTFDIGASEAELERIAAIINYRFIDFFTYFGVISTFGLSNDFKIGSNEDFDPSFNYSLGAEAGLNLGLIQIGAEVGKFFGEVGNPGSPDLDISGLYGKILVGFGF